MTDMTQESALETDGKADALTPLTQQEQQTASSSDEQTSGTPSTSETPKKHKKRKKRKKKTIPHFNYVQVETRAPEGTVLPKPKFSPLGAQPRKPGDRSAFSFEIHARLDGKHGRTGTIHTPHGDIQTPCFIPVATQATMKAVTVPQMHDNGAQAMLANAFHLYERPGEAVMNAAGGLNEFMNWDKPTFTDSGGFQVMSLGAGFKKTLAMDVEGMKSDDVIAEGKERLAWVDEDGVSFKSPLNGGMHRFSAEISMRVQHNIGADIMFAFDELTTLMNTRKYQEESVERTYRWAQRCVAEHKRLTEERVGKPYQALFGVIQGANYEDLRRHAAQQIGSLDFDGFGLGGAIEKNILGDIVSWICDELPENKPRHLLGIAAVNDIFAGVENGADTFDCVAPARTARNGAVFTKDGRWNIKRAAYKFDFSPIEDDCDCYTCTNYTRAYVNHLLRAGEMTGATLATIHNERFFIRLLDQIRESMDGGYFDEFKEQYLARFYANGSNG